MPDRPEKVIAILGMHRSGTSCLTGTLQQRGLVLGKFHAKNPYNRKGNRENQDVVDLNDAVLAANGGRWNKPPAQCDWQADHVQRAREILQSYSGEHFWGFKDPRSLLTIDGWLQLIPDIEFIGTFRNPSAVAASLAHRDEMAPELSVQLWCEYNQRLLALQQQRGFALLCFDWDEPDFQKRVEREAVKLGLENVNEETPFFSEELRSHRGMDAAALPPEALQLYEQLRAISDAQA